jgi:hypothetical protein
MAKKKAPGKMTVFRGSQKNPFRFLGKENSTFFMREKRAAVVFIFFSVAGQNPLSSRLK